MRQILVDTGAWLALFHRRDQHHEAAVPAFRSLRERRAELLVSDLILAELHLHLMCGFGPRVGREYLETIKSDPLVTEVYTDADLQRAAFVDWLERFEDQAFSLTDAVSFALMGERRISGPPSPSTRTSGSRASRCFRRPGHDPSRLRRCPCFSQFISRWSQARAIRRSRSTVAGETSRAAATSGWVRPPK